MFIITACRDFALGLAFCLTECHVGDLSFTVPEAALARCRTARPPRR
jgi:hypothetical protein